MKLIVVCALFFCTVDCARILGLFYMPSWSHQKVFREIWKELSHRGHELIVITPNPTNENLINVTQIDVSVAYESFKYFDFTNLCREYSSVFHIADVFSASTELAVEFIMATEGVQELLKKPDDYFDLIMIETHLPTLFGIQHKFKAPMVALSSFGAYSVIHHLFGSPTHPVLYPCIFTEMHYVYNGMNLWEKLDSLHVTVGLFLFYKIRLEPISDKAARKYFGNDMPHIRNFLQNTSLLFLNINPIFSERRPLPPNVIQYHNIQSSDLQTTPKDLQKILDDAKEGVVYFSLGTNVRFDHVQGDIKKTILEALGELPYTVLCKWESEDSPAKPKNVVLRKWFPQQSVLAHPNIKVFVTQGGLQSSEEAISNGVPLVVIPFLGDQPMNAKILTSHGMAETIPPKILNKDNLRDSILKVAKDEKYRLKAQELRSIFLDQPQSGVDKIIWWCEYVIRHKGAKHLRSPGADIPLYEYFMLDVFGILFAIAFISWKLTRLIVGYISRYIKNCLCKTPVQTKVKDN